MKVSLMCCLSDIYTCHCAPHRVSWFASEAQHRRCPLLKSFHDRYRTGPWGIRTSYRHREPADLDLLLGPSRGPHQCHRGMSHCFQEPFPTQP